MIHTGLILASNSPRRRELLSCFQVPFRVSPVSIDEDALPGEEPGKYVMRLAVTKGHAAASAAQPGELVVSADTTVADGAQILGKPASEDEASQMLAQLRNRMHQVYTALAVYDPHTGCIETSLARSDVRMRNYSDAEIQAYIATRDPFDKAGGYAIQNGAFLPVDELQGCYSNVVGLPLCHLARLLQKFYLELLPRPDNRCIFDLGYECPYCRQILLGDKGCR
ncbi:MAG TPA: Maf family protein [Levilinea sp.]|nr:Maf family protein [Levilinea sp.]